MVAAVNLLLRRMVAADSLLLRMASIQEVDNLLHRMAKHQGGDSLLPGNSLPRQGQISNHGNTTRNTVRVLPTVTKPRPGNTDSLRPCPWKGGKMLPEVTGVEVGEMPDLTHRQVTWIVVRGSGVARVTSTEVAMVETVVTAYSMAAVEGRSG
jgi:hypothetical protein